LTSPMINSQSCGSGWPGVVCEQLLDANRDCDQEGSKTHTGHSIRRNAERRDVQLKESAAESKPNCGYVLSNGVAFTNVVLRPAIHHGAPVVAFWKLRLFIASALSTRFVASALT
jgi:hypothetical protein